MVLTRHQRERLVLDLYNQGKSTREIAEEARMSFKDIGTIIKKARLEKEAEEQQGQKLSLSSHAYKLFSKRKTLAQVATTLNLREPEVTKFYIEYCKLAQLDSFYRIYENIKDDIYPFVKLYMLSKVARMDTQHVIRLLTIANSDLPAVEYRYEKLKREEASLQAGNRNSAITFQELSDKISTMRNTLEQYEASCKERRLEIEKLNKDYARLEAFVNDYQSINEEYLKIVKTVEENVLGVLSNGKMLLRYALLSITESARNDPERYRQIFYNMSSQHPLQDYNTDATISMMVDEAEKLYDRVVKDCINKTTESRTNKTINDMIGVRELAALSLLPQKVVSDVQKESTQKLAAYTYRKEEEHTFIQSEEIDNEENDRA
jgi:transposase